jgi:ribosomal protein S18 acetylase RimI-like enzyme
MSVRLCTKSDGALVAEAQAWDMTWFGRGDGQTRIGLISLEVPPEHRRKGYARFLVNEIFRLGRENMVDAIAVATGAHNEAALSLYGSMGFEQIDEAILYRLPNQSSDTLHDAG